MIKLLLSISISVALAQIIDVIITRIKTKNLDITRIWQTGGFPSSHTAGVSTLVTGLYILEGLNSTLIVAICLAAIVIRDAMGVRLEVGKHSKLLNTKFKTKLNEKAGHTPIEVIGGMILGILIALITLL